MLEKTRAIVLNSLKYGESQMIVDMYTEGRGRLSFIQRIPRQGRGGIKKQYFQPLTILDIEFDYRATQRLHKLRSAAVAFPFRSLPFDMAKLSIALFVAEFTIYVTRSEQADPALYAFVENSVRWLDACEGSFANFHIIYMLHLTRFIGFYPNVEDYASGCSFDMREGCFVYAAPPHKLLFIKGDVYFATVFTLIQTEKRKEEEPVKALLLSNVKFNSSNGTNCS